MGYNKLRNPVKTHLDEPDYQKFIEKKKSAKNILDRKFEYGDDIGIKSRKEFLDYAKERGLIAEKVSKLDNNMISKLENDIVELKRDGMQNINAKSIQEKEKMIDAEPQKITYRLNLPGDEFYDISKTEYEYYKGKKYEGYNKLRNPVKHSGGHLKESKIIKFVNDEDLVVVFDPVKQETAKNHIVLLLDKYGFEAEDVIDGIEEEIVDGKKIVHIFVNSGLYEDVPFLSGGRILSVFQSLVDELPKRDEKEDKELEWRFEFSKKDNKKESAFTKFCEDVKQQSTWQENSFKFQLEGSKYNPEYCVYITFPNKSKYRYTFYSDTMEWSNEYAKMKEINNERLRDKRYGELAREIKGKAETVEKLGSIKKLSYGMVDPMDTRLLSSGVSRLGDQVLKSKMPDVITAYWAVDYLANKLNDQAKREADEAYRRVMHQY